MISPTVKTTSIATAIIAASILLALAGSSFAENRTSHAGIAPASAHEHAAVAKTISGRIVAVRRVSRMITVQTPQGDIHEVKVPESAIISSHEGSHFNNVRSGQDVHLSVVHDPSHGLVAHSVSIP